MCANEKKYKSLIKKVQTAIVVHDGQGRILDSNPLALRLLGLSSEQMLGKSLIDPEWHFLREDGSVMPVDEYPVSLVLSKREPLRNYITGIQRPNLDDVTWALVNAEPEYDDTGKITQVIVSFVDITERKRAEQDIALLSFALNNVSEAVFLIDENGCFHFVNEESCRILEYTHEELLGLGVPDIDPDFPMERWPAIWNDLKTQRSLTFESRHKTKGNRIFPVEINANYFKYGEKTYILALARDITERKAAERALQMTQFATDHAGEATFWLGPDAKFIYVNEAACRMLKYSKEELLTMSVQDISQGFPAEIWPQHWQEVKEKKTIRLETSGKTKDGHIFPVELSTNYLEYEGSEYIWAFVRDITERKKAEQKIIESELKMTRFIANLPAFFFTFRKSSDGIFCFPYASPGIKELYGLDPEDIREDMTPLHMLAHPEDRPHIEASIEEAFRTLEPFRIEYRVCRPGMPVRWLECRSVAVPESDGSPLWHGIIFDISKRKRVEEELRDSEERLRLTMEAGNIGSWDWNIITGDVIWSDQCKAHYGFSPETSISYELFLQALHPDDRDKVAASLNRAVEEGKDYDEIKRTIWPDGSIHWTHSRGQVYYDTEGKPVRMVGVTFDITERKLAEAKLLESEERFRSLVTQAADAFYLLDRNGRILDVNQTACTSLGYSREELLSLNIADVDTEVESNRHKERFWDTLQPGKPATFEGLHRRKDGSTFPVEVRLGILELGNDKYMLGLTRDITDRKQAEKERQDHLYFLECMDQVNRAIQGANDLETMMSDVLDEVLSIFDCDRAYLLYPCDPEATSWTAPMERTRPEYPGVLSQGLDLPIDTGVAESFRILLNSKVPVKFGPGTNHPLPKEVAEQYGFKCFMGMAIFPKIGKPWQFGIHQCSYVRNWTPEEERLLLEIGRRLEDALTTLLTNRQLQESEQRFRLMFENSPVSIWEEDFSEVKSFLDDLKKQGVTDMDSYLQQHPEAVRQCAEKLRVLDVNLAALKLHGAISKEELMTGLLNTFTPESFTAFRQELVCLWQGGTEMPRDAVVKTLSGDLKYVTINFSVCPGYERDLSKVLVSIADITERKQAEQDREKLLRDLNAKNKELQSIVYISSHDLKTPLVNINGFSYLLNEHCQQIAELFHKGDISDDVRQKINSLVGQDVPEDLGFISSSADRMNEMIEGLLRVSRIGVSEIRTKEIDVNQMISKIVDIVKYPINVARTEITIDRLPNCTSDENMLTQLFSNLIDNAIKYLDPDRKGRIHVTGSVQGEN